MRSVSMRTVSIWCASNPATGMARCCGEKCSRMRSAKTGTRSVRANSTCGELDRAYHSATNKGADNAKQHTLKTSTKIFARWDSICVVAKEAGTVTVHS